MTDWINKPKRSPNSKLLTEEGPDHFIVQEDGFNILLEPAQSEYINKPKS